MSGKTQEAYIVRGYKKDAPDGQKEEMYYFWKENPEDAYEMAKNKRNKMFFDEGYREPGNIATLYHVTGSMVWDNDLKRYMDPS